VLQQRRPSYSGVKVLPAGQFLDGKREGCMVRLKGLAVLDPEEVGGVRLLE
jgi:hypothetical protein